MKLSVMLNCYFFSFLCYIRNEILQTKFNKLKPLSKCTEGSYIPPCNICHTGIERAWMYSCKLALEGDGVNAMPCSILTIQEVEVNCLCHVFNVLIFVSIFFRLILVEHLSISTVWSSVFGSILKCKILGFS